METQIAFFALTQLASKAPFSELEAEMFKMLREAKGRMQIGPLIEQSRYLLLHHGIHMTSADWDDPYLYGYFNGSTFVLLKAGSMDAESIGAVQARGWTELTTLPDRLFLTRTQTLSGCQSEEWKAGFQNGVLWSMLLTGHANRNAPKVVEAVADGREFARLAHMKGSVKAANPNELQDAAAFVYQRDWFNYIAGKKQAAA